MSVNVTEIVQLVTVEEVTQNITIQLAGTQGPGGDHLILQNIGTNTHAQIDIHISSTSNPHSVTKTQVGLSNVDNTSDLDKPISTLTQGALDDRVPYVGASADIDLGLHKITANEFQIGSAYPIKTLGNNNEIIIGKDAGKFLTNTTPDIICLGTNAGDSADMASSATFIGDHAGYLATSASNANFVGSQAGFQASGANDGNFFGGGAGFQASDASNSNFFGAKAGYKATNAFASNFFGYQAGYQATNAYGSSFFGSEAGYSAVEANNSFFFGTGAGTYSTNASYSFFFGPQAGLLAPNASNSIFLGAYAGAFDTVDNVTGDGFSIAIGNYSGTGGFSNSIAIGRGALNSASLQMNFGNVLYGTGIYNLNTPSSTPEAGGKIGIMTDAPTATLDIEGDFKLGVGGSILTSVLAASATLDFPSIASLGYSDLTLTVTGAAVGDVVSLGIQNSVMSSHLIFSAWVSASDMVTVRCSNAGIGAHDPASASFKVLVTQF